MYNCLDIGSIAQSTARSGRATEANRVHKPPQKVVLTVPTNKKQLIDIIGIELFEDLPPWLHSE